MKSLDIASRLDANTRLECRICWYVYDPALGDEVEQIPPGTPFTELPPHWRCPQCDAEQDKFLPLEDK
jgi:rubredoxin